MLFNARAALSQASRDLLDVADDLREHGWCQGTYSRGDETCVLGAILRRLPRIRAEAAAQLIVDKVGPIGRWNDVRGRTKDEVVAKLEDIAWSHDAAGVVPHILVR